MLGALIGDPGAEPVPVTGRLAAQSAMGTRVQVEKWVYEMGRTPAGRSGHPATVTYRVTAPEPRRRVTMHAKSVTHRLVERD